MIDYNKYSEEFDGVPCTPQTYEWLWQVEEEWHNSDELLFDCGEPPEAYWYYLRMGGRMTVLQAKIVMEYIWQQKNEIASLYNQNSEHEKRIAEQERTIRNLEIALGGQKYPTEKLRNLANHLLEMADSLEDKNDD